MQRSAFRSIPIHNMGFKSGHRQCYDSDGVLTLESISNELRPLHESINGYPGAEPFDSHNCAYFIFGMGYHPETPSATYSPSSSRLLKDSSLPDIQESKVHLGGSMQLSDLQPMSGPNDAITLCRNPSIERSTHNYANYHTVGRRDLFSTIAVYPELAIEVAKHLPVHDLVSLYAISKPFHGVVNGHMAHCMRVCAEYNAPESARVFMFPLYENLCVSVPVCDSPLSIPAHTRKVPSLKWLQMVIYKERAVREILACMARQGHRMPKGMGFSLKKMWLTMEVATTSQRVTGRCLATSIANSGYTAIVENRSRRPTV